MARIFAAVRNEFFIIEGDSLLVDMLTCPDRAIDWTHGGQFLHLLWAIEEFINTLLNCGAKFEVIFFDSHICSVEGSAIRFVLSSFAHLEA